MVLFRRKGDRDNDDSPSGASESAGAFDAIDGGESKEGAGVGSYVNRSSEDQEGRLFYGVYLGEADSKRHPGEKIYRVLILTPYDGEIAKIRYTVGFSDVKSIPLIFDRYRDIGNMAHDVRIKELVGDEKEVVPYLQRILPRLLVVKRDDALQRLERLLHKGNAPGLPKIDLLGYESDSSGLELISADSVDEDDLFAIISEDVKSDEGSKDGSGSGLGLEDAGGSGTSLIESSFD